MLFIFVSGPVANPTFAPGTVATTLVETGSVVASCTPWRDNGYLPLISHDRRTRPWPAPRFRKRYAFPLLVCERAKRHKTGLRCFRESCCRAPRGSRLPETGSRGTDGPPAAIVVHPAGYEPMLATASRQLDGESWAFEPKLDGWRAIVHVGEEWVSVYSRPGRDVTADLPQLRR